MYLKNRVTTNLKYTISPQNPRSKEISLIQKKIIHPQNGKGQERTMKSMGKQGLKCQ